DLAFALGGIVELLHRRRQAAAGGGSGAPSSSRGRLLGRRCRARGAAAGRKQRQGTGGQENGQGESLHINTSTGNRERNRPLRAWPRSGPAGRARIRTSGGSRDLRACSRSGRAICPRPS